MWVLHAMAANSHSLAQQHSVSITGLDVCVEHWPSQSSQMSIELPQFVAKCRKGVYCEVCMNSEAQAIHREAWAKRYSGVPQGSDPCILGTQVRRFKAVAATQKEIEERIAIPCDKRDAEGKCTSCRTCQGEPPCSQIAKWKDCPAGFWVGHKK